MNVRRRMEQNNTEEAETGDVNKQICRLCLEVIPSEDCETIEETKKEQLEALLINIDLDVSDNAVACNRCVEKLQECFDFKSTCSCADDDVSFVNVNGRTDIKPAFKKELSGESTYQENKICRLCMLTIEDESLNYTIDSKDVVFLRGVIKNCMPQIDLDTVHESVICNRCLSNTKTYNDFMKTCLEVEQRIQYYRQVVAGSSEVVLEDVLKFKYFDRLSQPVIIKKECSDAENDDVNGMICPKNEDIASIKCEEIDIKDELDNRVEASEFLQSTNCNSSAHCGSSKRNAQIRTSASNEERPRMYSCPKCSYSSNKRYRIVDHKCPFEHKVHKCFICPSVNNSKFLLGVHMASHKGPTKAFACPECSFETDRKSDLRYHFVRHKDKSKVEMYKCEVCKFSTKHKRCFVRHQVVHKNPEEISMYKCKICAFETKHKRSLTWHKLTHEDPTLVNKFKCDKCTFRSKRPSDVKTHMMTHSDQHPYRCDQCAYSSTIRRYLVRHKRMNHMDVEVFYCATCDFKTKYKGNLKQHVKICLGKQSENEEEKFKSKLKLKFTNLLKIV